MQLSAVWLYLLSHIWMHSAERGVVLQVVGVCDGAVLTVHIQLLTPFPPVSPLLCYCPATLPRMHVRVRIHTHIRTYVHTHTHMHTHSRISLTAWTPTTTSASLSTMGPSARPRRTTHTRVQCQGNHGNHYTIMRVCAQHANA